MAVAANRKIEIVAGSGTLLPIEVELLSELAEMLLPSTERIQGILLEIRVA